jgi:hypothetical protein
MLAKRLSKYGLSLSGGALATVLTREASAAVPCSLAASTVSGAVGQAVAPTAVVALSKEVLTKMFLAKLKLVVGTVLVVAALGAGGVAYQVGGPRAAQAADGKPLSELEALRKENELLRYNLQVILEKSRAQEAELRALKVKAEARSEPALRWKLNPTQVDIDGWFSEALELGRPDSVKEAEAAVKALRDAKDPEARRRAADALEQAVKKLREQPKKPSNTPGGK